jgi:hypothetical protein
MLPPLLKRLLTASNGAELTTPEVDKTPAKAACFQYTFLGDDGRITGEIVLDHKTNTYSNFSLTTFGLGPTISPEGIFWQEAPGKVLIDFKVSFAEGDEVDSLKGKLTVLDSELKKNQGRWRASVRSSEREVAMVKGTWSRFKV